MIDKSKLIELTKAGQCQTANNWNLNAGISPEDFIDSLDWLYEDPAEDPYRPSRMIGVDSKSKKIVPLKRLYYPDQSFQGIFDLNGRRWPGDVCAALYDIKLAPKDWTLDKATAYIKERLDAPQGTAEWLKMYDMAKSYGLIKYETDYNNLKSYEYILGQEIRRRG